MNTSKSNFALGLFTPDDRAKATQQALLIGMGFLVFGMSLVSNVNFHSPAYHPPEVLIEKPVTQLSMGNLPISPIKAIETKQKPKEKIVEAGSNDLVASRSSTKVQVKSVNTSVGLKPIVINPKVVERSTRYHKIIRTYASKYNVDPTLVEAVVHVESKFDPKAKSGVGAVGLMQLMPSTAKEFGAKNRHVAWENLRAGTRYLAWLLKYFDGNERLAIAAYNAGPTAVKKYGGVPPFTETQSYVRRVMAAWHIYQQRDDESNGDA